MLFTLDREDMQGDAANLGAVRVSMIAAMSKNRVIGAPGGGVPWELPRDVEHFRRYVEGKFLLVGRRTYTEMEGWFAPCQGPAVLTRRTGWEPSQGMTVNSVAAALAAAASAGHRELVVIGGAGAYHATLSYAQELILTFVDVGNVDEQGSARFPDYEEIAHWQTLTTRHFSADDRNPYSMTFVKLQRS